MEMMVLNAISLNKDKEFLLDTYDYDWDDKSKSLPFINFILEDKSKYPPLSNNFCYRTNRNYIDRDSDFLVGDSGGILLKWDFIFVDTEIFSKAAITYSKYKRYCLYQKDSLPYKEFYALETHRRKNGMSANCKLYFTDVEEYFNPDTTIARKKELLKPLRITGDHYNYLNYSRIERTPTKEERDELDRQGLYKVKTIEDFPRFWDGDYWSHKVEELKLDNDFNNITAKARRKGYSYKRGGSSANTLNLYKNTTIINVADDLEYLTGKGALSYMTKLNLDHYENNTNWRRGYLSEPLDEVELGYKKKHTGNRKYGFLSRLLSFSINRNIDVAIGKKALEINAEESGKLPNLKRFLNVTLSNMESGQLQVGNLNIWGTGGTKGSNWEDFSDIFYHPLYIDGLCFENIWDDDMRHETCGYFHPQVLNYEPYVVDGNSLLFDSYLEDKKDKARAKANKSNEDYIIHCAQRANKPSEAFINTTENLFESPELNKHIADIKTDSRYHFYTDGWYIMNNGTVSFYNKDRCINERIFNGSFHDYIVDVPHKKSTDIHGCVREYYLPYKQNDKIPDDLYFIVVDPYGVDKLKTEVTDKHSLYSFQVYMRDNGIAPYKGKKLIAEYTGRLNTMKENDLLLLYACIRWNAKALVEKNRGETISNFKVWKMQRYLLTDPTEYNEASVMTNDKQLNYGISIGGSDIKLNGLTFLKNFVYEIMDIGNDEVEMKLRLHEIFSLAFLLELQRFTSTGNWDRISTAILAMYEFKKDEFIKRYNLFHASNNKDNKSLYQRTQRT